MYNIMNVFESPEDEFYPNGCSVIFRKSEISEPFDAEYFYYSEDVYLGLKARFAGMKIRFVKDSIVQHYGGGSGSPGSKKTYYSERNRLLNVYLFFSILTIVRVLPYIVFNHSVKLILSLLCSKYSFPGLLKAYFWFYFNIPWIIKKRKSLQKHFKASEKEVISKISSKVFNGNSFPAALVNRFSYYYSRAVGLKPIEYFQRSKNR
jgi:GT2 family glycosyltransferase